MLHVTQADPYDIAGLNGLLSFEKYHRIVGDEVNHNTTESDLRTGRSKFVYMSLGNAYIGGNNSRLHDITIVTVNAELLANSKFVVQADAFNKLEGLFEKVKPSGHMDYHYLNQTTLIGEDFLELASMALVKGALSYTDFNRSEIMIRDELPLEFVAGIARSLPEWDQQISVPSTYQVTGANGESVPVSQITVPQLVNMQFQLTTEEKFWANGDTPRAY